MHPSRFQVFRYQFVLRMLLSGPRTVSKAHKEEAKATLPSGAASVSLYAAPLIGSVPARMLS